MGIVIASWKATDSELLQLLCYNEHQLISTSLDHSICVWNALDGSLLYYIKYVPKMTSIPLYDEFIWKIRFLLSIAEAQMNQFMYWEAIKMNLSLEHQQIGLEFMLVFCRIANTLQ